MTQFIHCTEGCLFYRASLDWWLPKPVDVRRIRFAEVPCIQSLPVTGMCEYLNQLKRSSHVAADRHQPLCL